MAKKPDTIQVVTLCTTVIVENKEQRSVPPGTLIALAAAEAEDGLQRGLYAAPSNYVAAGPTKPVRPRDPELVKVAIVDQLRTWTKEDWANEEMTTASGKPAVAVLEKQLGYDITAEEREAAFEEVRASLV
jgi:hypothetical protein